jgi:hypothetical protein
MNKTFLAGFFCADMALESCEGGELFDQIVRVGVVLLTMPTMRIIYLVYLLLMHGVLLAERSPV